MTSLDKVLVSVPLRGSDRERKAIESHPYHNATVYAGFQSPCGEVIVKVGQ